MERIYKIKGFLVHGAAVWVQGEAAGQQMCRGRGKRQMEKIS